MKVYNLVRTCVEGDSFMDFTSRVRSFSTEKKAEAALNKDYRETLKALKKDNVLDIVEKGNYGYSAVIKMGYKARVELDYPEVEAVYAWRITTQTVDDAEETAG